MKYLLLIIFFYANLSIAKDGLNLAKANACLGCHSINKKIVGPSFKDIAKRYKNSDSNTVNALAYKVVQGGAGAWGIVPMPKNSITQEDAQIIVNWIIKDN